MGVLIYAQYPMLDAGYRSFYMSSTHNMDRNVIVYGLVKIWLNNLLVLYILI